MTMTMNTLPLNILLCGGKVQMGYFMVAQLRLYLQMKYAFITSSLAAGSVQLFPPLYHGTIIYVRIIVLIGEKKIVKEILSKPMNLWWGIHRKQKLKRFVVRFSRTPVKIVFHSNFGILSKRFVIFPNRQNRMNCLIYMILNKQAGW